MGAKPVYIIDQKDVVVGSLTREITRKISREEPRRNRHLSCLGLIFDCNQNLLLEEDRYIAPPGVIYTGIQIDYYANFHCGLKRDVDEQNIRKYCASSIGKSLGLPLPSDAWRLEGIAEYTISWSFDGIQMRTANTPYRMKQASVLQCTYQARDACFIYTTVLPLPHSEYALERPCTEYRAAQRCCGRRMRWISSTEYENFERQALISPVLSMLKRKKSGNLFSAPESCTT